jgi:GMP synthase-like glutamine amidotransferase
MKVLVVQNHKEAGPGNLAPAAAEARTALDVRLPAETGDALPGDDRAHHGLLILGDPQHAWDDHAYLRDTVRLIRLFHEREKPVLGVCLGAQLIARAFGGKVYANAVTELGFAPVHTTDESVGDPLLVHAPSPVILMQWHHDTFDLPKEATRLMTNKRCVNQAFRIDGATYGFQPHFEVLPEAISVWIASDGGATVRRHNPAFLERAEAEAWRHDAEVLAFSRIIARAWFALVGARASER